MRKNLRKSGFLLSAAFSLALITTTNPASAEVLMNEYFEYPPGNLYNQGGWFRVSTQQNHPIQVIASGLTYQGYQNEAKGGSARLSWYNDDDNLQSEDLARPFANNSIVISGTVYVSLLMEVEEVKDEVYTFTLACPGTAGMTDGKALGSDVGRLFILPGDTNGTFKLGMSKFAGTATFKSNDLALNTPHLVVMSYTFVDGTTNDVVKVWVNPADFVSEPTGAMEHSAGADANATRGIQGVYLRQGSTASKNNPIWRIDAIRAATTWAELFPTQQGGTDQPGDNDTPKITSNVSTVTFGSGEILLQGQKVTATVNVKAENLKSDISVAISGTGVTVDLSTITKEEAQAAGGKNITLTYTAATAPLSGKLTLTSEGAEALNITLNSGEVLPVIDRAMLSMISNVDEGDNKVYHYTGSSAVVTFVDTRNKVVYVQDMSGAIAVKYEYPDGFVAPVQSDKLKDIYVTFYENVLGVKYFMPVLKQLGTKNGTGERSPSEAIVSDIKSDPDSYLNKLVTLKNIVFPQSGEWGTAVAKATSEGVEFNIRAFAGTDLIGTPLPSASPSITGIITSVNASGVIMTVRSSNDVVAEAPELEYSVEKLVDNNTYCEVGKTIDFAKVTVKTKGIKGGDVWLSGTNRDQFSVDKESLPAGSEITVITVQYKPTKGGAHSAMLNLDVSPTELSETISLSAKAYDPANPPTITVDSSLTDFSCAAGDTQVQTISYTAKNLLDYSGTVKVVQDMAAFQVNNTSVINGNYELKITFAPKSEGTYNAQLVFSAPMAETVTLNLKGATTGGAQEEQKQGDELVFDTTNPYATYSTDFENAGENYKPLSLQGWKNVAMKGTRAWWTRQVDGASRAAYATAYDSNSADSTPCEMLLISPALDFKSEGSHLLQFSVMGDMLSEGMNDILEVVYIDMLDGEPYYETLQGLALPSGSDYNGEWVPYVIDLEGQDLADVFFIGFRFTSVRGKESTAQYYIDDFAWNKADVPFIRVSSNVMESVAKASEEHITEKVKVTGLNLTSDISLKLTGANASKFSLSHSKLPAAGGEFYLMFMSEEKGIHEAYVDLSAEGAPTTLVYFLVNNQDSANLEFQISDPNALYDVYDTKGNIVMKEMALSEVISKLRARRGEIFVIRGGENSFKYMAK